MKIKKLAFFAILAITIFAGCEDKEKISQEVITSSQQTTAQAKAKPAIPTFNLKVVNGNAIKIIADFEKGWKFEGLENKVVLLNFFGTWCPPCKAEIPHLNDIRSKLGNDFEIVGVDIGPRGGGVTTMEVIKEFIETFEIKYPVSIGGDNGKLYSALRELNPNGSIPFMVLLNKKGEYVTHYVGMVPQEMLEGDINKLLGK